MNFIIISIWVKVHSESGYLNHLPIMTLFIYSGIKFSTHIILNFWVIIISKKRQVTLKQ